MGKKTWAAVHLDEAELAALDALVEHDCSSRSAVLRKGLRALQEQQPPFLPGPNATPLDRESGRGRRGVAGRV